MFDFDEATHTYTVDSVKVPSVTDLVSVLGDDIDESLEDKIDAAAERGTICHCVLEMLLNGETQ